MRIHNSEMDLTKEIVLVLIIEDENPSWLLVMPLVPTMGFGNMTKV